MAENEIQKPAKEAATERGQGERSIKDQHVQNANDDASKRAVGEVYQRPGVVVSTQVRGEVLPAGTDKSLPQLSITPARALEQGDIGKHAEQLHEAISQKGFFGGKDPDLTRIDRLLQPLSQADRAAVERAYNEKFGHGDPGALRKDLRENLGEARATRIEAVLNRQDGRTNDAGAVQSALADLKENPQGSQNNQANARLAEIFKTLNSEQISQLRQDYLNTYNKDLDQALREASLSSALRNSLPTLMKGSDKRSAADIESISRNAVDSGDRALFTSFIGGDSEAAKQARANLSKDETFREKLADKFSTPAPITYSEVPVVDTRSARERTDPIILDYLEKGHIGLDKIAQQNTGNLLFNNKDNLELAVRNATTEERQKFLAGETLSRSGQKPANEQEKDALSYYENLNRAFNAASSPREVSIYRDNLINGRPTLVSELAHAHNESYDPLGLTGGHKINELMHRTENLSEADWKVLHDPTRGPELRKQLDESLKTYTTQEERERILKLVDDKAKATSYEESKKVVPSLENTIATNSSSALFGLSTNYDGRAIAERFGHMSAQDAALLKTDESFRRRMEEFVNKNLNGAEKLFAQHMLRQAQETGQPPQPGPVDRILADSLSRTDAKESIKHIEDALKDQSLRDRLSKPGANLTDEERQIKAVIESQTMSLVGNAMRFAPDSSYAQLQMSEQLSKELLRDGKLSPATKLSYDFPKGELLPEIAKATPEQRAAAERFLSKDEKAIVAQLTKQNGAPDLADKLRTFVVTGSGNASDFKGPLSALSDADKQNLKDRYFEKYGSTLNDDFLTKIKGSGSAEEQQFQRLLTPATSDGRQDLYDNYEKLLRTRTGTAADGTGLTVERANQLYADTLESYNSQFRKLSPEQQKAMNEFFGKALDQHKESKERMAEILTDATLTAAALAGAPFTAGLSTAALATVIGSSAAAAGAYRIGVFRAVQGEDFDTSTRNVLKQGAIGFTTGALNLAGPELFMVTGRFAAQAGTSVARELAESPVKGALKEGADRIISDEIKGLAAQRGFTPLTEQEATNLVDKIARSDATATERAALRESLERSANSQLETAAARASEDIVQRGRLGRQIVESAGISAGANTASELVVAPFNGGIDWRNLQDGAMVGLAVGAVMPVGLRALSRAGGELRDIHTRITKGEDGLYVDPRNITEPVSFRNTKTGELHTINPGEGEPLKLTNEWQPESAEHRTVPISPEGTTNTATGKPHETQGEQPRPDKPIQGDNPERPLTRPDNLSRQAFTPSELKEVSTQIASRLGERSVSEQQFKQIFDGEYTINGVTRPLSEQERKLAAEVLEQTMPNLTSRSLDARMKALQETLDQNPNWSWQRRVDAGGRPYPGANILVLDGTTDGNALAHIFQKNTGVAPTVKVLQGESLDRMREGLERIGRLEKANEGIMKRTGGDLDQVLNPKNGKTAREIYESNLQDIQKIRKDNDLDNAIIFDDIRKATPEQREVLTSMQNLVAADLNGFNRAPNLYDFASIGMGAGTDSMRSRIGEIIERANQIQASTGAADRDAVRQAIDNGYGQAVRELGPRAQLVETQPTATRRDARDATAQGNEDFRIHSLYSEITQPPATPEQIEKFLGQLSAEQQRLGAQVLRDGLVANNYSDMARQARELQANILKTVPGGDPKNMLILTGVEENGSAYLVNSIFSRTNGLTADNFVSVADLRELAAKKPGEKLSPKQQALKEALGEKRLVYLDDYAYSNRQMPSLINNLQEQTLSRLRGPDGRPLVPEITVGTLGRYELPQNTWTDGTTYPSINPGQDGHPYLRVNVAESPVIYKPLYDTPAFRQNLSQDDRLRLQAWLGAQSLYQHSTIPTAMFMPYGGPNNNVPWIQAFIESPNGLRLPARFKNADWSEIEAGSPDFDRAKVLGATPRN